MNIEAGYIKEEQENEGIYRDLVVRMEKLSETLIEQRKSLKPSATYPKPADLGLF